MRLTLRAFGLTVLELEASTEDEAAEATEGAELAGGTTASTPIGFCPTPPDQRWQPCADFGEDE